MDFSWSTPLRQNGQTSLPLIPNEIYLAIFECIAPSDKPLEEEYIRTFSALVFVCRFFCSVALPRVFERVTFSGNPNNRAQASRKTKWARQIVEDAEPAKSTALYVKECTFDCWDISKVQKWVLFPFATLHCQAMVRMSNIRTLVFSTSFLKKDHWEAMAELKQLDVLKFHFCSFIEDPPDKELTVRTVILFGTRDSPIPFTLRPIATTAIRSLDTDDVEAVRKLVTFRQLAIDNLVLDRRAFDIETLLHIFQHLPGLESVTLRLKKVAVTSPLSATLSLKKLFTRLRSCTITATGFIVPRHDIEILVSALCDGPGTLPTLEELNLYVVTADESTTTLDIISDRLDGTIIPAFPNLKCINAGAGFIRLEEGNWKVHHWSTSKAE